MVYWLALCDIVMVCWLALCNGLLVNVVCCGMVLYVMEVWRCNGVLVAEGRCLEMEVL